MSGAFDPTSSALGITLVYLVLGVGALVLLGSLFVQLRGLGRALRPSDDPTPILRGSAAASVGVASIVGAALAVELGGPGALPWMWLVTFLGMGLVWASTTAALRSRGHDDDGHLRASPIRAMQAGLAGAGAALGIAYALALALAAVAVGALLHGQQVGALFHELAGAPRATIAAALALVAAPLILSPGTRFGPRLRHLSLRLLPLLLMVYVGIALAALLGDASGTRAALELALSSAFSSDALSTDALAGGASGGALAALTHAVLRTTMTGPGLGIAAFAPELAHAQDIERSSARAMLGPLLGAGLVGTLTALTLLSLGANDKVVAERELVFLEAHQSRALLPSERGQTIVLPEEENTPLQEGNLYEMVLRSNPRGHKVGRLLEQDNLVVIPDWKIAAKTDTLILRDGDPKRRDNAGFDVIVPCTREVVDTRAGTFLKLTPKDPTINLRALMNARTLEGPYVALGDFHFVGAVERAISGHPRFGEHLALYEPEREGPPVDPSLRDILQLGYRGPYVDSDEEPLPPALVGAEGFLPEIGSILHLRLEPPERGLDLGFINRAKDLETPPWDMLAAAKSVVLRHPEDPSLDVLIPIVAREHRDRLRFNTAVAGFSFGAMQTMTSHEGPYILPAPVDLTVEVHGDARLPARYAGRRALIPIEPEGRRLPDLETLFATDMRGPVLAADGASALARAWRRGLGSAGEIGAWVAALATFALGAIGLGAWAGVGAASLSQVYGAGAGLVYRLVFVLLCALGGTLTLADVLGIADVSLILAAQLHLIGLVALLPRLLARRSP